MNFVWSAVCAMAAFAAGAQRAAVAEEGPQMRTKVLPGYGYIRYEVLPGDDETPAGELIVVHEERKAATPPAPEAAEEPATRVVRRPEKVCSAERAKLIARLYEMQGVRMDPELAEWLEKNLSLGTADPRTVQILYGEPLLVAAVKSDGMARALADDLASCERAHAR
jgi:hypothetical protein